MSWADALSDFAKLPNPEKSLAVGVHLMSDKHTLAIYDGYEKAKYHFLVMPRDPFPLASGETLGTKELESLASLLKCKSALEVLLKLEGAAKKVEKQVKDSMMQNEGWTWDVQVGFHAVESMKHVHLHVISGDLISPKLKHKKHYNSFSPASGFFLPLSDIIAQAKSGKLDKKPPSYYEGILKGPLVSFYDGETFPTIPKLKTHLEEEWEKLKTAKLTKGKGTTKVAKKAEGGVGSSGSTASGASKKSKRKSEQSVEGEEGGKRSKS